MFLILVVFWFWLGFLVCVCGFVCLFFLFFFGFVCFFNTENETLKVLHILPENLGIPLLIHTFRKLVERDFAIE